MQNSHSLLLSSLIRYQHPTFVKHVLAPKNEFGMPKMTWGKVDKKKTEKKTDKCQFWPYIHTYYIKTDIFLFFFQATTEIVDKLLLLGKKQKKN